MTEIENRQQKERQALIEALKEMPIVQVACKRVGVSRATYYRWRKEDMHFYEQSEEALSEGIEYINDMSESQLVTLIKEKKMPAIAMWLRHNHMRYGSKGRTHTHIGPPQDLSPEEETIVLEALALTANHGTHTSIPNQDQGQ